MSNLTRMVGPNGEIITILPIEIRFDRNSGAYSACDGNSGRCYSISELEQLANTGDPSAQCAMGDYYNAGNYSESELRQMLEHGASSVKGAFENFSKALEWYKKAANQNHAQALWNLGNFYATGMGIVEKDFEKAVSLMEESAKYGFLDALFNVGQIYMLNDVYDKAFFWLEKADSLGHPEASTHLEAARLLAGAASRSPELQAEFDRQSKEFWNKK